MSVLLLFFCLFEKSAKKMKFSYELKFFGEFVILLQSTIHIALAVHDNEIPQDHSSKGYSEEEISKLKLMDEHNYYLPMQTTFNGVNDIIASGVSVTSPPHLIVDAPVMTTSQYGLSHDVLQSDCETHPLYSSRCMSETASVNMLKSQLLMPSKTLLSESMLLAGHAEVASRTSEEDTPVKIDNTVPIVIQGTLL